MIELEPQAEEQEDQPERRHQLDIGGLEGEREELGVRAREEPDEHIDRDRREADQLSEPAEDVGDDEQDAQDEQVFAEVLHAQLPGGALGESAGAFALNSPVR